MVERWSPKPNVGSSNLSARAKNSKRVMKKIINYIKDSYNELVYKVSWPSRTELTNSAVIVMIASIIMALIIWGVDTAFENVVKLFYSL